MVCLISSLSKASIEETRFDTSQIWFQKKPHSQNESRLELFPAQYESRTIVIMFTFETV